MANNQLSNFNFSQPISRRFSGFLLLACFFILPACTSYGPAPPILVPDPQPLAIKKRLPLSIARIYVLPATLPENMEDIGTFFKNDGSYSQLIPENPLGPALDAILVRELRAGGIDAIVPKGPVSPGSSTLRVVIRKFQDKVKEGLLQTTQEGKIRMDAILVLHSGDLTRKIVRTMERHSSPKPILSFDSSVPAKLLGRLYSESITKDLVPFLRKQIGETP
ncbi:MAG: hypothetical protein M0041_03685 [Nitrospiraceae bacterium]|nr:hypothetical protein [Nitrospiraceae bacterium]